MLKKAPGLTTVIFALFFLISCAGVSQQVPLETLVQEAENRVGEPVTLGGYILDTRTIGEKIYMTVLQTPLGLLGRPQPENTSEGNFLVAYNGAPDLNNYRRKRQVTVTGKIAGIAKEDIDNCPRPCLKIESSDVKVWSPRPTGPGRTGAQVSGGIR